MTHLCLTAASESSITLARYWEAVSTHQAYSYSHKGPTPLVAVLNTVSLMINTPVKIDGSVNVQ
jgi:hypothetical protein